MFKLLKQNYRTSALFITVCAIFFFIGCASQDLEFLRPYQFINNDFEDVADLPPLVEEEPEIEQPAESEIKEPEVASQISNDLEGAESDEDIDEETVAVLSQVSNFVEDQEDGQEEAVASAAEALDEEEVDAVLNEDAELDEAILAVANAAAESDQIGDLFPTLDFPEFEIPDGFESGRVKLIDETKFTNVDDFLRIEQLVGPCADAANTAYNNALGALNNQRTTLTNTARENHARRLAEAESRFTARNNAALVNYRQSLTILNVFISNYIRNANNIARFNPRLASNLRYYALLYLYRTRFLLDQQLALNNLYLSTLRFNEISTANSLLNQSLTTITNNYNTTLATLDTTLRNSLNNCHNQGTGN
jgi:hypothetical protein